MLFSAVEFVEDVFTCNWELYATSFALVESFVIVDLERLFSPQPRYVDL